MVLWGWKKMTRISTLLRPLRIGNENHREEEAVKGAVGKRQEVGRNAGRQKQYMFTTQHLSASSIYWTLP